MQPIHDYYQRLAPTYDRERFGNSYGRYVDGMERRILRRWLRARSPQECVELACGTGRLLEFAMTGVDLSSAMLAEAGRKWPDRRLVQAEAAHTGLPSGGVDAAYSFHLLMHLPPVDCLKIFHEAARIVRPGGSFIFDIPSRPRRSLSGRLPSGWHGDTAASIADIGDWIGSAWRLKRWRGVLFFPIHRLPLRLRESFAPLDAGIGNTPLARWSSYYLCELERI